MQDETSEHRLAIIRIIYRQPPSLFCDSFLDETIKLVANGLLGGKHNMNKQKIFQSLVVVVLLISLASVNLLVLSPRMEQNTDEYLNESLLMASQIYLLSRTINAGISVLQETSISASPIGIGLSFPVGQVLDPINDATERVSDLSVYSMGIIAAQRLAVELGSHILGILVTIFTVLGCIFLISGHGNLSASFLQISFLLLTINLTIPITALAGEFIDRSFFTPEIAAELESLNQLKQMANDQISQEGEKGLLQFQKRQDDSSAWYDLSGYIRSLSAMLESYWGQIEQVSKSTTNAISYTIENFSQILDSLTSLFALWLAKVIFQGSVLPLLGYVFVRQVFVITFSTDVKKAIRSNAEKFSVAKAF